MISLRDLGALARFADRLADREQTACYPGGSTSGARPLRQWVREWRDCVRAIHRDAVRLDYVPERRSWPGLSGAIETAAFRNVACDACGEDRVFMALIREDGARSCANCLGRRQGKRLSACSACGITAPIEDHHLAGWRHGGETVAVCLNCHAALTALQRWHEPWGASGALMQGVIDYALLCLFPDAEAVHLWPASKGMAWFEALAGGLIGGAS